jgi:hypothetical protein
MFGICNLAIIPLRFEPNDKSEIVSQVLFGEHFKVLEQLKQWSRVKMQFDGYEGWVDSKQYQIISESSFDLLSEDPIILNSDLVEYITDSSNLLIPIPLGSSLSFINHAEINKSKFDFEGTKANGVKDKKIL